MSEHTQNVDTTNDLAPCMALPNFEHPMLQLLATTPGLPERFQAVALVLRQIFDNTQSFDQRLDFADDLDVRLSSLALDQDLTRRMHLEVLLIASDCLPCGLLWERCALLQLRVTHNLSLSRSLSDTLPKLPDSKVGAPNIAQELQDWMTRMYTTPVVDFVHTLDDGQAAIRLLRLYAMTEGSHGWHLVDQDTLSENQLTALGLWRRIETRMRAIAGILPKIGSKKKSRAQGKTERTSAPRDGDDDPRGIFHPSYGPTARHTLMLHLMGKAEAEIVDAQAGNKYAVLTVRGNLFGGTKQATASISDEAPLVDGAPPCGHLILLGDVPPASGRDDKDLIARYQVLRSPLPLPPLPTDAVLRASMLTLHGEFPWATQAIDRIGGQLLARQHSGSVDLAWTPLLLVGEPGCGKSRLARRIAEVFALPFLLLPLAGSHDPKILLGTARSWGGAQPSPVLQFMLTQRCARAVVLLDEVDKFAETGSAVAGALSSSLLNFLEVETAKRWYDSFLQVSCDLSKLLFIATANSLGSMSKPLLSRFNPVLVPAPQRRHYARILHTIVADIAAEWGVPVEAIELPDAQTILAAARSVRELKMMTTDVLAQQAREPRRLH